MYIIFANTLFIVLGIMLIVHLVIIKQLERRIKALEKVVNNYVINRKSNVVEGIFNDSAND